MPLPTDSQFRHGESRPLSPFTVVAAEQVSRRAAADVPATSMQRYPSPTGARVSLPKLTGTVSESLVQSNG